MPETARSRVLNPHITVYSKWVHHAPMRICISGTFGTTSLVHRLMYDEFSILHKPTVLSTVYKEGEFEVMDIPDNSMSVPVQCDMLILTCKSQKDVEHLVRKWFGLHKRLIIALIDAAPEDATLCPKEHLLHIDNMTREGLLNLVQLIHAYK